MKDIDPVEVLEEKHQFEAGLGTSETEIYESYAQTLRDWMPPGPELMRALQDLAAEFSHVFSYYNNLPKEEPW